MELLVPAGNWESFLAGINNGADAVYIGGKNFNARQNADNFTNDEINRAIEYAHLRDKKVYITVNTLIDQSQFDPVLEFIYNLYNVGVDAVIVQDLGLMDAINTLISDLKIHASTQMTIHNSQGVNFLKNEGIKRIVLAREMSLSDLQIIRHEVPEIELEVFVHGAICYSYSGQCLFSSLVGGRSGNRGQCAQPCRLSYELYDKEGKVNLLNKGNHLLSPADLCLINHLSDLNKIGIDSLKIEGRMKRPEYVAVVTKAYREAIKHVNDNIMQNSLDKYITDMFKVFNRHFSTGYLFEGNEPDFLSTEKPNNSGFYLGQVIFQDDKFNVQIKLAEELSVGDGIQVINKNNKKIAQIVKKLFVKGKKVKKAFKDDIVSIKLNEKVEPNDKVYKTHDEELLSKAYNTIKEDKHTIKVDIDLSLQIDKGLKITITDDKGNKVEKYGDSKPQIAEHKPLDYNTALDKVARLGDTPFSLRNFNFSNSEGLLVPFSDLNSTRRRACEELLRVRIGQLNSKKLDKKSFNKAKDNYLQMQNSIKLKNIPKLSVFVSNLDAAKAAIDAGADIVYMGIEGISTHKKVRSTDLKSFKNWVEERGVTFIPALPRIQKPMEIDDGLELIDIGFKDLMVGNLGSLEWCRKHFINAYADFSLNIFNPYALNFISKNVSRVCLSPEISLKQLNQFSDLSNVELIIHGELIIMTSQYCMLSGVLDAGTKPCSGQYCRDNKYYIKDKKGFIFPVETDRYCRFYVFNSRTLCMVEDLYRLCRLGVEVFRIEAKRLNKEQVKKTVEIYKQALEQINIGVKYDTDKYKQELIKISNSSFTKGHYFRGV